MGHEGRECYYDVASNLLPATKKGEQKILKWRCRTKPMRLTSQHIRKEEVRRPDTDRIRGRTLTYRKLQGEELAHIPKATKRRHSNTITATRRSIFPQSKGVENSPPKTSKCQIDEKCRKRLLASSPKAPRTTHNGDPTSWENSSRRTAPGQFPEDRNQRKSPSERRL